VIVRLTGNPCRKSRCLLSHLHRLELLRYNYVCIIKQQHVTPTNMQKITPFLWFNNGAEEALNFYASVFKNTKIGRINHMGDARPDSPQHVMTGTINIDGLEIMVMNAASPFKFNESVSLFINCKTQEEVDHFWEKLSSDGGQKSRCGWLKDKFGVSWQVIPETLMQLMGDKDAEKAGRVMQAMMKMDKIVIKELEEAYRGERV
jgi:predicted 3-demethylubiquinone-9 3-methyltransferase (glyoxalase superfamily)